MATLKSKNGVLGPQLTFYSCGCHNSWYVGQKFIYGSFVLMVTSNSHQNISYGHLKVQKWGFGPLAHILFMWVSHFLVCRLEIHIWVICVNGNLKLPLEHKLWSPLSPKMRFWAPSSHFIHVGVTILGMQVNNSYMGHLC